MTWWWSPVCLSLLHLRLPSARGKSSLNILNIAVWNFTLRMLKYSVTWEYQHIACTNKNKLLMQNILFIMDTK